jgi:chemotaxis protein CheX
MNVKFLNPFVQAAKDVLKAELGIEAQRGELSLQKSSLTYNDLTVLISMVGEVQGVVLYSMAIDTALSIVSQVLQQEFTELSELAESGVGEMANVISGRATVLLSETGISSNISPPTLIKGRNVSISTLDFDRIVVPLITDLGEITTHLALREVAPKNMGTGQLTLTPQG